MTILKRIRKARELVAAMDAAMNTADALIGHEGFAAAFKAAERATRIASSDAIALIRDDELLALGEEVERLRERVNELECGQGPYAETADSLCDLLLRHGFTRCDIAACNCGSWHHRYGLPERMNELIDELRDAGMLNNSTGNLPLIALRELRKRAEQLEAELAGVRPYRDLTFDGNAVFDALEGRAKQRTSPGNVSDVLDALHRAAKAMRGGE